MAYWFPITLDTILSNDVSSMPIPEKECIVIPDILHAANPVVAVTTMRFLFALYIIKSKVYFFSK